MSHLKPYIPNGLTILRIILMVPFVVALAYNKQAATLALAVIIITTDYFDGYFARRWDAITDIGKILDPLADKLCSASAAVALIHYRGYPLWLFLAIVARDLLILLAGLILIRINRIIPVSNISGKIAVGFISLSLFIYLINIESLKMPSVIAALVALFISIILYARFFIKTIKRKEQAATC
jgi:CDP-diacylglycerol--glycerol-3-phosphate 3-phosphatidyltransferase